MTKAPTAGGLQPREVANARAGKPLVARTVFGFVSENERCTTLANCTGLRLVDHIALTPSHRALRLVPARVSRRRALLSHAEHNRMITAISRPYDEAGRNVAFASGRSPYAVTARPSDALPWFQSRPACPSA